VLSRWKANHCPNSLLDKLSNSGTSWNTVFAARATTGGYLAESFLHSSRTSRQTRAERREQLGCWRSSWNNSSTSAYSDGIDGDDDDDNDDDDENNDDSVTMRADCLKEMKEHIITHHHHPSPSSTYLGVHQQGSVSTLLADAVP